MKINTSDVQILALSFLDTLCESQALNLYGHSDRIKRNHDLGHRSVIDCIGDKLLFNLF